MIKKVSCAIIKSIKKGEDMEILKNFIVGVLVICLAFVVLGISIFLFPFIVVAGSVILLSLKTVLFIVLCVVFVITVGYVVRKGISREKPDSCNTQAEK